MGPSEDHPKRLQNQGKERNPRRNIRTRRPRSRICLLKGCGLMFRPEHPLTRYCSQRCRDQARRWREWKARHRYRQSFHGKRIRRAQSCRYRVRRKERKKQRTGAEGVARVIPRKFFFVLLRSSRMLRGIPPQPPLASAAVLFPCMSPCYGTCCRAREALAGAPSQTAMKSRRYSPDILRCSERLR
jgi:hypothetical protein